MSNREAFLARRKTGIGGSDVGAICGLDPFRSALDVYLEKVGEVEAVVTPAMDSGIRLEPIIKDLYQESSGRRLKRARFRRHKEHQWMVGHPDALIAGKDPAWKPGKPGPKTDGPGVFESKAMGTWSFKKVVEKGLFPSHQLQGQHYAKLCDLPFVTFGILDRARWQYVDVTIEADSNIQNQVIETCAAFWYNHVVPKIPPKVEAPAWTRDLPEPESQIVTRTDDEWRDTVQAFIEARAMAKEAGELKEHYNARLQALLKDKPGTYEGGGARAYLNRIPGKRSLDKKQLLAAGLLDPVRLIEALEHEGYHLTTDELEAIRQASVVTNLDRWMSQGDPYLQLQVYGQEEE